MYLITRFLKTFLFIVLLFFINIFAQTEIAVLEVEKPIERELKGGEAHAYKINLTANQFLHVVAEQKGIDVVLTLFAPDGKKLFEIDSPNGALGSEPLYFVAGTTEAHRLEVRSLESNASAGKYEVSIKTIRTATADDKSFISAKRETDEGLLLRTSKDEASKAKAFEKFAEAARLFRQIEDKERRGLGIFQIGQIYREAGRREEALQNFNEARGLFEEIGSLRYTAAAYEAAGLIYLNPQFSQNIAALNSFNQALAIAQTIGDKKIEATNLLNSGITYYTLGDLTQAVQNLQQALKISQEMNYQDLFPSLFQNLGVVYSRQNNYAKALEYHQKDLALREVSGARKEATFLNIGNVYTQQGNSQQALEYFQKALTGFENAKATVGTAFASSNMGVVYLNKGEYDKALEYFQKAQSLGGRRHPQSLSNIGLVYIIQGKYTEASEYLNKALNLYQELGDTYFQANTRVKMAKLYLLQGDYLKSLDQTDQAVRFAQQFDYQEIYFFALQMEAKARLALGQKKEAKQALESAIIKLESLRELVAGGESAQQLFFETKTAPFQMLVDLSIGEEKIAEAFIYAERAKSRTLLDVLQSGKIDFTKAMTDQERTAERRIKNELSALNMQISRENKQQPDKARLENLNKQLEKKRLEFEDFQTRLYASHPELKVQRGEMKPISAEEAAKLLPDDKTAFLEYVVSEDKAFLFALTKDAAQKVSLKVYPIEIKQKDLAEKVESFRSKLAEGNLDFAGKSHDLYNSLLKPAEAQLKGKTNLIIVPDSILWELPFQALQLERNKYLIETAAVSYAPSLTALREMSRKNKNKTKSSAILLAFGNPSVGKETSDRIKQVFMSERLEPLPEAERLVNSLRQIYGENRSKIFVGAEAREEIAKTESQKYKIVQFAAHGILNDVSPMYSHIVLAQKQDNPAEDGLLEAWEMKDLELNAEMVILSACETARGRFGSGEGVIGMSWALFIAGAPATVASQWKVESSSTTELMLEFHRQLLIGKGISKAEALRRASLKLLKTPQYKHPSYWAGFVIVGDGF